MIKIVKTNVKDMASVNLKYGNGALIEKKGVRGVSHLVEHCMCEDMCKKMEIKLNTDCVQFNAYTSDKSVQFMLWGLEAKVQKHLKPFIAAIVNYTIPKNIFERERKIVIAECEMYLSQQDSMFDHAFCKRYLNYSTVIGELEDLKNITYEQFIAFKNEYYANPTELLYTTSDDTCTEACMETFLKDLDIKYKKVKKNTFKPIQEYSYTQTPPLAEFKNQQMIRFWTTYDTSETDGLTAFYMKVFKYYLVGNLQAILYKDIRTKLKCVYGIRVNTMELSPKKYLFTIDCQTNKQTAAKVIAQLNKTMDNIIPRLTKAKFNDIIKEISLQLEIDKNTKYVGHSFFKEEYQKIVKIITQKLYNYDNFINDFATVLAESEFRVFTDNND